MYRVIEMLRIEARRYGVAIGRVDMIGLIPEQALIESAQYYMNVTDFSADKLLENNIQKHLDESIT
jgi:glutamate formiminotransferase / 5-formyltetrahydrofolate cyclo-ligase